MVTENPYKLKRVGENLYRNGLKTYFAIIKVGGTQIKKSLKTQDEGLAKRRLTELRQKVERIRGVEQRNIRFDELAGLWLESIRAAQKPSSHRRRVVCINGLLPFFKVKLVKSISEEDIEKWKIKRGAELSARSFNIELETLNLLLRYAVDVKKLLLDNPVANVKRKKQDKTMPAIPEKKQFCALLTELSSKKQSQEAANLVEFLAYSGCRLGEAIEVKWRDVNFQLGTVLITGGELGTKNHEERVIPLFGPLRMFLERLRVAQFGNTAIDRIATTKKLFNVQHSRQAIISACERLGLPRFGHHSCRHFFCSNAIEQGVDFKTIAEWLGHRDGGTLVAKTYGHLRAEHSMEMAKRITFTASEAPEAKSS